MNWRAEADPDVSLPLRRAGGLRIATAAPAACTEPASPQQVLKRLVAICRGDVADTVPAAAAAACRLSSRMDGVSPAQASLWRELADAKPALAEAKPALAEAIAPGAVWMMRRGDGSFIGTYRLGEGGRVGLYPHPNESRWRLDNGVLRLQTPQGETTTEFRLALSANGRLCFVGLFCDGSTLHVLSQIDCEFGHLVMADPELAGCHDFTIAPPSSRSSWDAGIQPAVLMAAARTGSHLLLNLLNSTGRVFFDAEIMNFGKISVFGHDLPIERSAHLNRLRADDPAAFARVMLSRSYHLDGRRLDDVRVRGFKLFPEQHPALARWAIADPSMRIVHLFRANLLAEYASMLTAMENGHWVGGAQRPKPQRIEFDAPRFLRFVAAKTAHWSRLREQCAQREGGFVEIEYAGIDRAGIERVLQHLGVEGGGAEMSSLGLPRQGVERVIDRFAEPDAVMRCLEAIGQEQWAGVERATVARL
jgi:LPS sulfotransferase NodH